MKKGSLVKLVLRFFIISLFVLVFIFSNQLFPVHQAKALCGPGPAGLLIGGYSISPNPIVDDSNLSFGFGWNPGCTNGIWEGADWTVSILGTTVSSTGSTNSCPQVPGPCGSSTRSASGTLNISSLPNGTYTVQFRAINDDGNSDTKTITLTISRSTPPSLPRLDLTKNQTTFSYPISGEPFGISNVASKSPTSLNWSGSKNVAWINALTGNASGGTGLQSLETRTASFTVNPAQAFITLKSDLTRIIPANSGSITENCLASSTDTNGNASGCETGWQTRTLGVLYDVTGPAVTLSANGSSGTINVNPGDQVTLAWNGSNCNAASPVSSSNFSASNQCSGSKIVTVNSSTTYTITIKGLSDVDGSANNFATANVTVVVNLNAPVVTLQGRTGTNAYGNGPISIHSGDTVDLQWTATNNPTSCTATAGTGSWPGAKTIPTTPSPPGTANQTLVGVTTSATYNITCTNAGGTSTLVSFTANVLTVTMTANPNSGPAPLNGVDLTSTTSGTSSGTYLWKLDCNNDGVYENAPGTTNSTNPYTATALCNYATAGTYTARVNVSHNQGWAEATTTVTVTAPPPTISNITVTVPDYCTSGPAVTVSWTYSSPNNSPQSQYQVQVADNGQWASSKVDKTIVGGSNAYFTDSDPSLDFNTTYKARVRVWDSNNQVSNWSSPSGSWKTPQHAYPSVGVFTYSPLSPKINSPIQFTDNTTFSDGNGNGQRNWSWSFCPSAPSKCSPNTSNGSQLVNRNPSTTYNTNGSYGVTETVTDKDGYICSAPNNILNVQRSIPIWKEISPGQ